MNGTPHTQMGVTFNNEPVAISNDDPVAQTYRYTEWSNLKFLCVDTATGTILAKTDPELPDNLPPQILEIIPTIQTAKMIDFSPSLQFFCLPIRTNTNQHHVAIGAAQTQPIEPSNSTDNNSNNNIKQWQRCAISCSPQILQSLLDLILTHETIDKQHKKTTLEIEQYNEQLTHSFEEVSLLYDLTQKLQVSRDAAELAHLCLERLDEIIPAEGTIIWLQERNRETQFLHHGQLPISELELANLVMQHHNRNWNIPLVKNQVDQSDWGQQFPGLKNFAVTPLAEGKNRYGWIFSCNLPEGKEFGTVEGSLLHSVATILGTHLRNTDLYHQHEELLLGFVRSLVSTLDAKDPYTRGHSQRVALIARRIAQQLNLPPKECQDIYFSGLLHDIGKIGINDQTLQKPGKLSDDEFLIIQKHPMIGYNILAELNNLQDVLPGIRSHHESFDGTGYPDQLIGENIPLMARILAVADSYDAMTSDRPYRKGLPLEKVEAIFRSGAGRQWDSKIIDAYFAVKDDIHSICKNFSPTEQFTLEPQLTNQELQLQ